MNKSIWKLIDELQTEGLTDPEMALRILEDPDYADYSYQQIMDLIKRNK